jgi:splicing factor 3A subunit 2
MSVAIKVGKRGGLDLIFLLFLLSDRKWQYLLFAAEPYETISFKVPSREVDKSETKFWTLWNKETKEFFLQFAFKNNPGQDKRGPPPGAPPNTLLPPPPPPPRPMSNQFNPGPPPPPRFM